MNALEGGRRCQDTRRGLPGCVTSIAWRQSARGRNVCLETEPWDGLLVGNLEFYYLDTSGVAHRTTERLGVPLFVCHTSREGHRGLSASQLAVTYDAYLRSDQWKRFAERAKAHVGFRCEKCDVFSLQLEVHHPGYEYIGRETFDKVLVLCPDCHERNRDGRNADVYETQGLKVCHQYYQYRHERGLAPRVQSSGRRRGSAFGTALFVLQVDNDEGVLNGQDMAQAEWEETVRSIVDSVVADWYDEAFNHISSDEERWELEVEIAKVQVMAAAYAIQYGIDRRREVTYEFPIINPNTGRAMRAFRRGGKIDGLIFYEGKKADVIEDKFVAQIQKAMIARLPLDEQVTEYVDALAELGWDARVLYRHTRFPSINPEKAKEFKTKPDRPAETIEDFKERLWKDVWERPGFYFVEEPLIFPTHMIFKHRLERWQVAQQILQARRKGWWDRSPTRCHEYGGCQFIPLCTGEPGAMDRYVHTPDNVELRPEDRYGEESNDA